MALTFKLAPRTPLAFKIGTKIPARLLGGNGITVTYTNGAYTISGPAGLVDAANVAITGGSGLFTTALSLTRAQNAATSVGISNTSTGTSALASLAFTTDSGLMGSIGATSNNYSTTILQDRLFINANAVSSGIIFNTAAARPIGFAINSTQVLEVSTLGGLVYTPPTGTNARSITSTQVGSTSSTAGPLNYNLLTITHQAPVTGSGVDTFGLYNKDATGFRVNLTIDGTSLTGQAPVQAGAFCIADHVGVSATPGDLVGLTGSVYSTTVDGASPRGLYGMTPYVGVGGSGFKKQIVGSEADVFLAATASATWRAGFRAAAVPAPDGTSNRATDLDAAFTAINISSAAGAFKYGFALHKTGFTEPPLATTGSVFYAYGAQTVTHFLDCLDLTVSGKIARFPNLEIDGNGDTIFGTSHASTLFARVQNTNTATNALASFQVQNNTGVIGNFCAGSTAYTGIPLAANRVTVQANASADGIAIVTSGADPIIFGLSDVETGRFTTTRGLFTLGVAGAAAGVLELAGSTSDSLKIKAAAAAGSGSTITLPPGTTDFSATGGAGQFVKQASAGAPFTVSTVAMSELSGLGTGVATALAVNVGSAGALVTFNGAGGTPSSITLTNGTGLPISTGVSGLGTGVATFLATPSSANLAAAVTDESGTGALVFSGSVKFIHLKQSVNFNSANTDNAFTITLPTGFTRWQLHAVIISGASASLTTATFGVFTGAGGTGTQLVTTGTACTVSTAAEDTANNLQTPSVINNANQSHNQGTVYFRVQTPQGSAATATVTVSYVPVS